MDLFLNKGSIKRAVIPSAGLGTRVFPATKIVPKGMLSIVDKPALQYIVEEAAASGIEDILIIINTLDTITGKHFSRIPKLEEKLAGKEVYLNVAIALSEIANVSVFIQEEQKGLGHAILQARDFTKGEPFAVLYADDVIIGDDPCVGQLCRVFDKYGKMVVGINEVGQDVISKYSSMKVEPVSENIFDIVDMKEKPKKGEEFSLYSILGRCVLTQEIFDILEETPPGAGGEIQLTDAMKVLALRGKAMGVDFTGIHYDIGNKLGIMKASVEIGLAHEEIGDEFREYLRTVKI